MIPRGPLDCINSKGVHGEESGLNVAAHADIIQQKIDNANRGICCEILSMPRLGCSAERLILTCQLAPRQFGSTQKLVTARLSYLLQTSSEALRISKRLDAHRSTAHARQELKLVE